ncbi:hypothetical protein D9M68_652510 [compost metagenome]
MARRYELPNTTWELIQDLVSPKQKMGRRAVRIEWCSMASSGSGALGQPGATCRNATVRERRCISVFATGETMAPSTSYWGACRFG